MPRFEFRLKSLLILREAARDQRRADLVQAFAAERELAARRSALRNELDEQRDRCRASCAPGVVDVERLKATHSYEGTLRTELDEVHEREQSLAVEIERCRQELVAADREVQVLEKLRERKQAAFRRQQAQAEVKLLDEVAARASGGAG